MTPSSSLFGWAILAATFLGPVFAVLLTRFVDAAVKSTIGGQISSVY